MSGTTCPTCGGTTLKKLAPNYLECTSEVSYTETVVVPDLNDPGGARPVSQTRTRICGNRFHVGASGNHASCSCGLDSIGSCCDCGRRVCGNCSMWNQELLCNSCLKKREMTAAEARSRARREARAAAEAEARERRSRLEAGLLALAEAGNPDAQRFEEFDMPFEMFTGQLTARERRRLRKAEQNDYKKRVFGLNVMEARTRAHRALQRKSTRRDVEIEILRSRGLFTEHVGWPVLDPPGAYPLVLLVDGTFRTVALDGSLVPSDASEDACVGAAETTLTNLRARNSLSVDT